MEPKTRKELIEKQMALYPQSIILDAHEVIEWAYDNKRRMQAVLMTTQHDGGVWYRFPNHEVTGFRYDLEDSDYVSGFSDL